MFSIFAYLFFLILFSWFIRTTKAILFWLYLWQLKEYHIHRFLAHFSTEKGKRLLLNKLVFLKIVLFFLFLGLGYVSVDPGFWDTVVDFGLFVFIFILFVIYLLEAFKAIKDLLSTKLIKPIFTVKIKFLFLVIFISTIGLLSYYQCPLVGLLLFDIFVPVIVSAIVLLFQPITVLIRNQIIKKAKTKRAKAEYKNLLVIGITGSYGKTSTKEFLYTILSQKYKVLKTKEHQNSEIGIARCILNELKPKHQIFICEMGAYKRGGIKLLCGITKPKIGILTGINEQHMATFGSQEAIIKAKYELIESLPRSEISLLWGLPKDGIAFFNAKSRILREYLELYKKIPHTAGKKILYGQETDSASAENIAGAIEVAKALGMSEEEINRGREKQKPWLQIKKARNNLNIIDATYSSNPDGVIAHLNYLKNWQGRKVIVMPCLIELGPASKKVHQRIGKEIAEVCDLAIITTRECFGDIKSGAPNVLFIEDPKEIFEKIKRFNHSDDIILLENRVPQELIKSLIEK